MDYAILSYVKTKILIKYDIAIDQKSKLYSLCLAECKRVKEASSRGEEVC